MAVEFQNPWINPRSDSENLWSAISAEEALDQCPPFATAFFREAKASFPAFFSSLRFMTWPGGSDIYAIYDSTDSPISIQIDRDSEEITIYSPEGHCHYGDWGDWGDGMSAQVSPAMEHLKSLLLTVTFGKCCKGLKDAFEQTPYSFFRIDHDVLYMSVGYVETEQGARFYDHAMLFCPFCGDRLQTEEEIKRKTGS